MTEKSWERVSEKEVRGTLLHFACIHSRGRGVPGANGIGATGEGGGRYARCARRCVSSVFVFEPPHARWRGGGGGGCFWSQHVVTDWGFPTEDLRANIFSYRLCVIPTISHGIVPRVLYRASQVWSLRKRFTRRTDQIRSMYRWHISFPRICVIRTSFHQG